MSNTKRAVVAPPQQNQQQNNSNQQLHQNNRVTNSSSNSTSSDGDEPKTNLIVNYLPQSMTDQEFKNLFATIGGLKSAKVVRHKQTGYSYGFGFVDFVRHEDAIKAIETLNGLEMQNKRIKVAFARPGGEDIKQANLYVKNIPTNWKAEDVKKLFDPFGQIIQCRVLGDGNGSNKGIAFVLYDRHKQAENAMNQLSGTLLPGSTLPLDIKFAADQTQKNKMVSMKNKMNPMRPNPPHNAPYPPPRGGGGGGGGGWNQYSNYGGYGAVNQRMADPYGYPPQPYPPPPPPHYPPAGNGFGSSSGPIRTNNRNSNRYNPMNPPAPPPPPPYYGGPPAMPDEGPGHTLFVYNIGMDTSEDQLVNLFVNYGRVLKANIVRKSQTAYGFITMADYQEAYGAIEALNGYKFKHGKPLQVSFKK